MEFKRRNFLGGALGVGAAAAAGKSLDASAKQAPVMPPSVPSLPPESSLAHEMAPDVPEQIPAGDYYSRDAYDSTSFPKRNIECKKIHDWLEIDAELVEFLETDPKHFSFNTETGELHVESLRDGDPAAMPPFDMTFDPAATTLLRIVGLPGGNALEFTHVTKDNFRLRITIRRNFFGDHFVEPDKPTPLMQYEGQTEKL